jgi:hypothetical protein
MSKPLSFSASLDAWRTMADNLAAHLDEMPQLRGLQEALRAIVERGEALISEAYLHESRLRAVNHEKTVVFREGREIRNQLALGLQAALGVHSERLIKFNVPPRPREIRRRPRRAKPAQGAAEAPGAEAEAGSGQKGDPRTVN